MRRLIPFLIVAVAIVALAGCGDDPVAPTGYAPGQTAEAYAYVHGGYVGKAIVTTADDGALSAEIDEAFLPHTLAIVDINSADWNEDNTVYYVSRGNQVRVAKHIWYAGTNYTGVTVGGALAYVESGDDGNAAGSSILEKTIIRNEANMAAWFENIANDGFRIYTEFGGEATPVTTTSYGSVFKRGSSYWPQGIGWAGNMDAIAEAASRFGVGYTLDEMNRNNDNKWELADAVTSATASDFPDYFALIQMAAARLKME